MQRRKRLCGSTGWRGKSVLRIPNRRKAEHFAAKHGIIEHMFQRERKHQTNEKGTDAQFTSAAPDGGDLGRRLRGPKRGHGLCRPLYLQRRAQPDRRHRAASARARQETQSGCGQGGPADRRTLLLGGVLCGAVLFAASSLQQIGIQYTTVGKAGFITACYIVIVPLLGLGLRKALRAIYVACGRAGAARALSSGASRRRSPSARGIC